MNTSLLLAFPSTIFLSFYPIMVYLDVQKQLDLKNDPMLLYTYIPAGEGHAGGGWGRKKYEKIENSHQTAGWVTIEYLY